MTLQQLMDNISEEDLKVAYLELKHWRESGVLVDGIVRNTCEEWRLQQNDFPLYAMESVFTWEMAKRYYDRSKE